VSTLVDTTLVGTGGLRCTDVTAGHGGIPFVRSVTLEIAAGKVLALIGPNGAGKTTLLLTLAGLLPRLDGEVTVGNHQLRSGNPRAASRAGLVLVPDDRSLFPGLTLAENLEAARRRGGPAAESMLELFPTLEKRWKVAAGSLSGGEQQMLAVARALMQEPSVLMIDELSMGLAPVVVEAVLPAVRRIADEQGVAVVLVEQHVQLALSVADEAVVLVHGEVALRGAATELSADPSRVENAYLGQQTATIDQRNQGDK
jgi:branched-chain amino acid transport system ATP-binding protein